MDSQEMDKKVHFSISTFKKSKNFSIALSIDDEKDEKYLTRNKRSVSNKIPNRFVPKIRPLKRIDAPPFFILNNKENTIKKELSNENTESKSVKGKEDTLSVSSLSESCSEFEEDKNSDKLNDSNALNVNKNYIEDNKNNPLSTLFNIRKKMLKIKNSLCLSKIKECVDLGLLNLKKEFTLDENYNNFKNKLDNEKKNFNRYNTTVLFSDNKNKKKFRPFLIFDVLLEAAQRSKI